MRHATRTDAGPPGERGYERAPSEVRRRQVEDAIRRDVLPEVGAALVATARQRGLDLSQDGVREEVEQAARAMAVRALFVFNAEHPGFLPLDQVGHVYESLLSLRLAPAGEGGRDRGDARNRGGAGDRGCAGDRGGARDRSPAGVGDPPDGDTVELVWRHDRDGRKVGGVYYTRLELVHHLVGQVIAPAFADHLARVRATAATDPAAAASQLLGFAVLDPACGGAHFLVAAVDELASRAARFLAEDPLPLRLGEFAPAAAATAADQGADLVLLRRLLLRHCVFGVDLSPAGAEMAKLALSAATSAPGLPPVDLEGNILVGDALTGPAGGPHRSATAAASGRPRHGHGQGVEDPAGEDLGGEDLGGEDHGDDPLDGGVGAGRRLDWPASFPAVFDRDNPGFDVVLGNPPWEELTVDRLAFYGRFAPGLRSLPEGPREAAIAALLRQHPGLPGLLAERRERLLASRGSMVSGGYPSTAGDPDLYKYFCRRYQELLREGGRLGVVLPRSAFAARGSAAFRRWLFGENRCDRIDFLVNRRLWAFPTHPQYTVALVAATRAAPTPGAAIRVAGTAASPAAWAAQVRSAGLLLPPSAFGPSWAVPLLRDQAEADLLAKLRRGARFPGGAGGRWRCFPVRELDETNDRALWQQEALEAAPQRPLWKGESFDQYDPHGAGARPCGATEAALARARKSKPGSGSLLAAEVPVEQRRLAVLAELDRARVAFRDVSRATDSRTVRACLIPPRTFLTNKAPYLAFVAGGEQGRALCLGVMNSLPFDWQARRFVEINLNFFVLEGLMVPDLDTADAAEIARCAARLSCADERFREFATATGVEAGPLTAAERAALRLEIDARVAHSWGLTPADLRVLLADFTLAAVPATYRDRLEARLSALGSARRG
jgi:hypothetical protein